MSEIQLRDYQVDCRNTVILEASEGVARQLVSLPTGLGKTVIFADLAKQFRDYGPTLVVVHTDELVQQAVARIHAVWPTADVGIVKAESNQVHSAVVVASVQTLSKEKRLAEFVSVVNQKGGVFLFVIDEAHHAAAASYRKLINNIPYSLLVGVTATPRRSDGKRLSHVFDKVTFNRTLPWAIKRGYLSDVRGMAIYGGADMSSVRTVAGDYSNHDLSEAVNTNLRNEAIVEAWQKHASTRRTLVFTVDVQHAHELAEAFVLAGVKAESIDGKMPLQARRNVLQRFYEGVTQVVTNCNVLTEGYDNPAVDCIVMARPTQSSGLYMQMLGRGTRLFPGKSDCLVLDVVDNHSKHKAVMLPVLSGREDMDRIKMPKVIGEGIEIPMSLGGKPVASGQIISEKPFELIEQDAKYQWVKGKGDNPYLQLPNNEWLIIRPDFSGDVTYTLYRIKSNWNKTEAVTVVKAGLFDIEDAFEEAELYAAQNLSEDSILSLKDAAWRTGRVGQKQMEMMTKLGIPSNGVETKGEASKKITEWFAQHLDVAVNYYPRTTSKVAPKYTAGSV